MVPFLINTVQGLTPENTSNETSMLRRRSPLSAVIEMTELGNIEEPASTPRKARFLFDLSQDFTRQSRHLAHMKRWPAASNEYEEQ